MNIVTGYRGEPHITSLQDRAANQGSYGTGSYVLDVGSKMAATAVSANEIHIADGVLSHQGCIAIISPGTYDAVEISNGTQGMNRIDRIVARYTKNSETNIESLDLVVIQGTATSGTPSAPSYSTGQIQSGALQVDMPLYNVRLTGITISSVTQQFSTVRTQAEIDTLLNTLSNKTTQSLKIVQYTREYTISANGNLNISANDFGASDPSGYNPVAITHFSSGNENVYVRTVNALAQTQYQMMSLKNTTGSAISTTAYIRILYAKSSLL